MRIGIDISQTVFPGTGSKTYTTNLIKSLLHIDMVNEYVLFGTSLRLRAQLKTVAHELGKPLETHFLPIPPTLVNILWNDFHFLPIERFVGNLTIFHTSDATEPPAKAKKVTTVHDLVAYHYPQTLHPKQLKIQKKRLAWVKAEADAIIAVSEATKRDLVSILEFPEQKISVIYEGVDKMYTSDNRTNTAAINRVKQKYHLPDKFLLNVGTLQPRKNLGRLVEAFNRLKKEIPLVIAGNIGWGNTLPRAPGIQLLGFVEDQDLPFLYVAAYGFLYPAIYEGFGLPVLEALASGTPVVTSNTSSLPEVGGDAAIYVDPHDTFSIEQGIEKLLNVPSQEYQVMQQKGLDQARKFSWEQCAKETLAVYERVAGSK